MFRFISSDCHCVVEILQEEEPVAVISLWEVVLSLRPGSQGGLTSQP